MIFEALMYKVGKVDLSVCGGNACCVKNFAGKGVQEAKNFFNRL